MPTMWFVKNGPRDSATRGSGISVSYDEIRGSFPNQNPKFLSKEPPTLNKDKPSQYPQYVVIEVKEDEENDPLFSQDGFYILPSLVPEQAQELLSNYREVRS